VVRNATLRRAPRKQLSTRSTVRRNVYSLSHRSSRMNTDFLPCVSV